MTASGGAPRRFFEGFLLLIAGMLSFVAGVRYLLAPDEVFTSALNFFFAANETSAPAIGLVLSATGAYWLWTATRLFRGDGRPAADLRCFFGGNILLFLGIYCISSTIGEFVLDYESAALIYGEDLYPDEESFEAVRRAMPIIGMVFLAAGAYWLWVAVELLRGNGKQAEDLRCFVGGHLLLVMSVISFAGGFGSFFESESDEIPLAFLYFFGVVLLALAAYWFSMAVKLLQGNREPVASLKRFWGGNILLIIGLVGLLTGMAFFLPDDDYTGEERFGFIVGGVIFVAWGACATIVALGLLRRKAKPSEAPPAEPPQPPAAGEGS